MTDVVQKLWGFCHTLRHDGIDYGDYIEQITFLLFLKMAEEKKLELPKGCDWSNCAIKAARDSSTTTLTFCARSVAHPGYLATSTLKRSLDSTTPSISRS